MKIQRIISQYRRDFKAIFICESCNATQIKQGYDDKYYHETVIPDMQCMECGKKAPSSYKPLKPFYPEDRII